MSTAARIVWNAALASLPAVGFVDLILLLNEWLFISPRSRITRSFT